MADLSQSNRYQALFESALHDYQIQTGAPLPSHPLAEKLQSCDSVDSVTAVLQDQARAFSEFRRDNDRISKSLMGIVSVLYTLSASITSIGPPFLPVNTIFAAFAIFLSAVKDVSSSYDALVDLLESIEHFMSRLNIYTRVPPTGAMTEIIVKIMVETITTLALVTKQIKQGRSMKLVKKLLGENEIEAVLQRLDRLTLDEARTTAAETIQVVYGLVQNMRVVIDDGKSSLDSVRDTLETIQQLVSDMNKSKRDKLQGDIRNWLSPPDPWKSHNIVCRSRHIGTANWFIQSDTFSEWKSSGESSLLWVHGKPGAGKSVLCSAVIEDIDGMRKLGLASMAFFYYDARGEQKKPFRGLLSSWLVQLCHQSDAYSDILSNFYWEHSNDARQPSDDALFKCLKEILELPRQAPVYLIMDALDECPMTSSVSSPRENVLMAVKKLIVSQFPDIRICITSRPEVDIESVLGPLTFRSTSLHGESGHLEDINKYIKSVVNTDQMMRRWKVTDKQLVIDVLTDKADGMFQWVNCQLRYLRHCPPGRIRRALAELPETLDKTYERALKDLNKANMEVAHRLFQVVAVASRPLSVEELAQFLGFDFTCGPIPEFRQDWLPADPLDAVLPTTSSLLAIVNFGDSAVIQFSHFSIKEFLTSSRLAEQSDLVQRFSISMTGAHTLVARSCLGILLHLDKDMTAVDLEKIHLAEYAAEHWVSHAQFEGVSTSILEGMETLFDLDKPHFSAWIRVYDIDVKHTAATSMLWRFSPYHKSDASPLYYAALCGFRDLAQHLIYKFPQQVNAIGGFYVSPLAAAVAMEHFEVAELLYSHGADVDVLGDGKLTPLCGASCAGRLEIVQWLLQHGATPSALSEDGCTGPLHLAALCGHLDVSRMLVEHGASMVAQDKDGNTPLHLAALHGHEGLARLLVEHGADMLAKAEDGSTPLHLASLKGHVDLARILVEHGADVVAQDKGGSTPLHWAARSGHIDLAILLIAHGADSFAQDKDGLTPLLAAAKSGHNELALTQALLTHGTDATAQDKDDLTRLPWGEAASESDNNDLMRRLSERGAVATVQDNDRSIPLHAASKGGHGHPAQLLVAHSDLLSPLHRASESGHLGLMRLREEDGVDTTVKGMGEPTALNPDSVGSDGGHGNLRQSFDGHDADVTAQDMDGPTRLHWASLAGSIVLARFLIEHGADATVQDKDGSTPLHWVSQSGHIDLAQLLIEHGADATTQAKDGSIPLHWASQTRHVDFAQFLVQQGADVRAQDHDGSTPLHWASRAGQIDLARFLVENGADVNAQDVEGFTPANLASQSGHVNLTQFFVEQGVDVTLPLHRASQNGDLERTLALLGRGVDANSRDENDVTPLHLASRFGHLEIVHSLLKNGASSSPRNVSGWTPLHVASEEGRLEIVRLLLDQGDSVGPPVDLNVENEDQQTPLFLASRSGRLEVAKFLLECGADFEHHDWLKRTPLHVASRNGHRDVTHLLLEKGVSVNAKDERLWSPLHMASKKGQRMVIQELLDRGAEVGSQNDLRRTPLHMASQEGHLEVVQLLLRYGADVDKLDVDEETALHLAAFYGHPKVTELLLKHDAKVYNRNKKGETPFDLASKEGHQDVANLLTVGFWEIVWDVVLAVVRLLLRL